jgi:hypothetical protein
MTVLADFQTIIGDRAQTVERRPGVQQLGVAFDTGGRIAGDSEVGGHGAFLIYSVTGLVHTTEVFVNGEGPVGTIEASPEVWSTQVIAMGGFRLNSGQNSITVRDVTDRFFIKDLICFYHQDSG